MTKRIHNISNTKANKIKKETEERWGYSELTDYKGRKQAPHDTRAGYCCACDYDLSVFESKIKKEYIKGYKKALRNVAGWNKEYEEMMIRNEVKKILDNL